MKLLVANRGEIACRIFETCRMMGIRTVAIYAKDDAQSLHVQKADEAYLLEGDTVAQSYLNVEQILAIAQSAGVTLIHPGYGFLSERAHFAQAVIDKKIAWVGPKPEVILKMGSKIESKILAEKAKVPTLPWKYFKDSSKVTEENWKKEAKKIGYPLLVKASGGGGGKGMRLIRKETELIAGVESATREATSAFGDSAVFLEKYLEIGRHIEVQIFSDFAGKAFHLFDRECSVQRRHQKIIEEAPAPHLSDKTRNILHESAVRLAESIGYTGAGTVEFMVDEKENVSFLEMNTRLQVEHPVTEWITGLDLVEKQILTALGKPIDLKQSDIIQNGHAIECRVYAEAPYAGFMPSPGPVKKCTWPLTRNTRIDTGIYEDQEISAQYDPMVAKISCWGSTRAAATAQMIEALAQTTLLGFTHNITFLMQLLKTDEFKKSEITTSLIEKKLMPKLQIDLTGEKLQELVTLLLSKNQSSASTSTPKAKQTKNLFAEIKL